VANMTPSAARKVRWTAVLSVLLPFSLYLRTLLPGLGGSGDSMKCQFVGLILGIPHVPGSPGYVLLNHLFSLLPIGSLAYRINLLSAICAATTCGLMYAIVTRLTRDRWAALGTTLLLAVSRIFWYHGIVAEVDALNTVFIAGTILTLLTWERKRTDRYLYLACGVYALSFGNHLSMITLLPAFVLFVLWTDRKVLTKPRHWVVVPLIVLAAASQYLFVWIRSHQWLAYSEIKPNPSLQDLIWFVTGGVFKGWYFALSLKQILGQRVPLYVQSLVHQFTEPGVVLGFLGLYRMAVEKRKHAVVLLVALLVSLTFSLSFAYHRIHPLFLPSYILFAIMVGYGLAVVFHWIRDGAPWLRWAGIGMVALLSLLASFRAARTFVSVDQSRNVATDEYAERVLAGVNDHTLLVTKEYSTNLALLYKLLGEDVRAGDHVYTAVGPDPGATIRSYRLGERGIISGYGDLDHLPPGLGICYLDQDPECLESQGFEMTRLAYNDGDLSSYLSSLSEGTWVLLSSKGEALSDLDQASRQTLRSLGLEVPSDPDGGTCYVAVAVMGADPPAAREMAGELSARVSLRTGESLGEHEAPTDVRISSIIRGEGSRWRRCLSDLREGQWKDAWHAFLAGPDRSSMRVDGREESPDRYGLNIVILDSRSGGVIRRGSVDVERTMGVNEVVVYGVLPQDPGK